MNLTTPRTHGVRSCAAIAALAATVVAIAAAPAPALAQQRDTTTRRDTTKRSPADSAARADSVARADSIFLEQQLKQGGAAAGASTVPPPATPSTAPINPRLLPDVSAVGDLIGDLSPKASTQEDKTRFGVREVEIAVQAAVDPYFRGDVFLGLSDLEKVSIEQAYLTTTSLPFGLEVRLGRYLMPVGKQNTTHRHDLHTIEYPWVLQRFFSPDGLKGTGVCVSKIFSPFGFYQELQATAVDRFGEAPDSLTTVEPVNKKLSGLAYSARLRNYWDFSQSTNMELSASAITGVRERAACMQQEGFPGGPIFCPDNFVSSSPYPGPTGVGGRQTTFGADLTYRWRPLQQGLYKSFILQAEFLRQVNARDPISVGAVGVPPLAPNLFFRVVGQEPGRSYQGGYVFARYQLGQRLFVGARYDNVQDPENGGATLQAGSGYLEWFPSEFSKLVAGYERLMPGGVDSKNVDRIVLQASFAVGPHKPHPF